jgi:glycosyltransferase involved in cell wall biosynthesis
LKVCLVGHFVKNPDEGVRNVTNHIAHGLERNGVEVRKINISSFASWREIKVFNPDVIHYILSPTFIGFINTKFLSFMQSNAKSVISAVHTAIPNWKFLSLFRSDIVLIQSYESEKVFKSIGCQTFFLPNGVDINKFKSIDDKTKQKLIKKYDIPSDKFIILHLASLKKERNLGIFSNLQQYEDNQVVIVGRAGEKMDEKVFRELKNAGCIVWTGYFPNLEEIYTLSDCYVFPTIDKKACIETPLSVLEAMSCDLPVITTKFGALHRLFEGGMD